MMLTKRVRPTAPYRRPRRAVALLAVVVAVAGAVLFAATPATAAATEYGTWRVYGNTNPITSSTSTWACGATRTVESGVGAQVCAIRSPGGGAVQAAVIVRNDRSSYYLVEVATELQVPFIRSLGRWECLTAAMAANSWIVCFGRTLTQSLTVQATGGANGVWLGWSSLA
ncbi:hypothetical protein [Cryptosporangium japonicum]|uniref:Secreted protein n=1 Tax=Cryptosporangium japonicum TaxID=80872 RepID=A0ABP3E299_9ACTN